MAADTDTFQDQLLKNATRLLSDSVLLLDHDRYASAFALAVLALEELGKLLQNIWHPLPRLRTTAHVQKQRAVAAVLLAQRAINDATALQLDLAFPSEADIQQLAAAMSQSQEGRFIINVDITALDQTKQLAIYLDQKLSMTDLTALDFKRKDVQDIYDKIRKNVSVLNDDQIMRVGKAIYLHRLAVVKMIDVKPGKSR